MLKVKLAAFIASSRNLSLKALARALSSIPINLLHKDMYR